MFGPPPQAMKAHSGENHNFFSSYRQLCTFIDDAYGNPLFTIISP
jgi:hypothetical protein